MGDSNRYLDWYDKAAKDLQGAKILLQYDGDCSIVAFHCQQAIEKALKGWILQHTGVLQSGHSLVYLCRIAAQTDGHIKDFLKDCAYVNQFYIETRYPADIPMTITADEAAECIRIAEQVMNHLSAKE